MPHALLKGKKHSFFSHTCKPNRLWTHGFDLYAPGETVVYHLWTRAHRPSFREGPRDPARAVAEEAAARRRVLGLLGVEMQMETQAVNGEEDGGDAMAIGTRYGLGTVRSLAAFEELLGVDFKRGLFRSSSALWGGQRPDFFDPVGGSGGLLGAEEPASSVVASTRSEKKAGPTPSATPMAPSAAAAVVMGTQNLQALMSSFLK
jgi:hypothetical protein